MCVCGSVRAYVAMYIKYVCSMHIKFKTRSQSQKLLETNLVSSESILHCWQGDILFCFTAFHHLVVFLAATVCDHTINSAESLSENSTTHSCYTSTEESRPYGDATMVQIGEHPQ